MATGTEELVISKRAMILRDSLAFLSLVLITVALFGVTLFLFRSFMAHREDLAVRWAERGRAALAAGKPEDAVTAYRTALSYGQDDHANEMMLAQALGAAGRTEESYNYFMELWEQRPGDGFINLQLARLEATKREVQEAVNFYRASIYGTWEGDGVERRRTVRLELARYLIAQHEAGPARNELLIAGGNAPDTAEIDVTLAGLLEQAGARPDALTYYEKALAKAPDNAAALRGVGRVAFAMGDYAKALRSLGRAQRGGGAEDPESQTLLTQAERLLQLLPIETLPARERVTRIVAARAIARRRLDDCVAQQGAAAGAAASSLQALEARWNDGEKAATRSALMQDEGRQAAAMQLVYDTEIETNRVCAAPTGDDALLLLLAQTGVVR